MALAMLAGKHGVTAEDGLHHLFVLSIGLKHVWRLVEGASAQQQQLARVREIDCLSRNIAGEPYLALVEAHVEVEEIIMPAVRIVNLVDYKACATVRQYGAELHAAIWTNISCRQHPEGFGASMPVLCNDH